MAKKKAARPKKPEKTKAKTKAKKSTRAAKLKAPTSSKKSERVPAVKPEPAPPTQVPTSDPKATFDAPLLDQEGKPLYCSDGCGRLADGRAWDSTDKPMSIQCFTEHLVAGINEREKRESADKEKAAQLRETRIENLAEAREAKALKRRCEKEAEEAEA